MTTGQLLVHCTDQLRMNRGDKPVTSVRVPSFLKPLMKRHFVSRLRTFKPDMRTLKELDAASGMTAPTAFEADRAALLTLLGPTRHALHSVGHPLFGHLTAREFGEMSWKYLDHHLRQFGA